MKRAFPPGTIDVLGLGCSAVDDIVTVETFPPQDGKVRILQRERQCGGLTATALVAAARVGARCAFAGVLGDNELSRFVEETLTAEGIDLTRIPRRSDASPGYAIILVTRREGSRTILFQVMGQMGADETQPQDDVIRSARVLFLDEYGMAGNVRAAKIARAAGTHVVADLEADNDPRFWEMLPLIDHLILSVDFARRVSKRDEARDAVSALMTEGRAAVVVTCGADGCWVMSRDDAKPWHCPAFPVKAIDTTGCGDAFHGAYAATLAAGMKLQERIRFSSAVAALKATQPGGQRGLPRRAEVEAFLTQHPPLPSA